MTDLFGVTLNIGDRVIYTTGAQSNTWLEIGTIVDIETKQYANGNSNGNAYEVAYVKTASGRKTTNSRGSRELVSIIPIATQHPELFI